MRRISKDSQVGLRVEGTQWRPPDSRRAKFWKQMTLNITCRSKSIATSWTVKVLAESVNEVNVLRPLTPQLFIDCSPVAEKKVNFHSNSFILKQTRKNSFHSLFSFAFKTVVKRLVTCVSFGFVAVIGIVCSAPRPQRFDTFTSSDSAALAALTYNPLTFWPIGHSFNFHFPKILHLRIRRNRQRCLELPFHLSRMNRWY